MAVKALAALACVNQSVLFSNLQSQSNACSKLTLAIWLDVNELGMDSCGNGCWASLIRWLPYREPSF